MALSQDEIYMKRCIELAKNGLGNTAPNPLVGSVIVYNNKIIGEGYHRKCGKAHAEVNAINSVKDKSLLKKSAIYVNLEPCAHIGRTPACAKLIVEKQIPNVIIGCSDSFEKVDGKGIEMLKKGACKVITGVLEKQSRDLNRRFFTFHEKKRPYIILKWAETVDGFIDVIRDKNTPLEPNWITDKHARMLVHKWRSEEDAIMVATNTAEKDNPKLNVRDWAGKSPVRIVLDRNLRLDKNLNLFDNSHRTIIFTEREKENNYKCEYLKVNFQDKLFAKIFQELYNKEIQSVIIEGGAIILNTLIENNYWDEARVFIGEKMYGKGISSPKLSSIPVKIESLNNSKLYYFRNENTIQ